jgi:hypothetical protein
MKTKVGLWIDHRKAVIVAVTDTGEEIKLIISKVEKQPRRPGGPMNHSKSRQMTAARKSLRGISTSTMMR